MTPKKKTLRNSWLFLLLSILVCISLYLSWHSRSNERAPVQTTSPAEHVGPSFLYPPSETSGAIDPRVTDSNIHETICVSGYSSRVRPAASLTSRIKTERIRQYDLTGAAGDYELDHFIPLELGGCPDCPANLWMEPYSSPGAREKDRVENFLHREVCADRMSLTSAQQMIARDWYQVYLGLESGR